MQDRYYKFSKYFKKRGYKGRVHKITVDAGFSCPNRDGSISRDGCIYCNNKGFNPNSRQAPMPVKEQLAQGIEAIKRRIGAEQFIAYFQAYTNTYASVEVLKEAYDNIREFPEIVGIAVATRPDCINREKIELINSYTDDYEVWIEYGLQSVHGASLEFINRGHDYNEFVRAVNMTRQCEKIKICAHVIIGIPEEGEDEIVKTAKEVASFKLDAVKVHPLHVVKDTMLESMYDDGAYTPLNMFEYAYLAVRFLEHLPPDTVIQRITADCPSDILVAPEWISDKAKVLAEIDRRLVQEDTWQGKLYKE